MLHRDEFSEAESSVISQLLEARKGVQEQLDTLTDEVGNSLALSNEATTQLAALHRDYDRAQEELRDQRDDIDTDDIVSDDFIKKGEVGAPALWGVLGGLAATALTGGAALPILLGAAGGAAVGGGIAEDIEKKSKTAKAALDRYYRDSSDTESKYTALIESAGEQKELLQSQLETAEQRHLYYGVVAEILLGNGLNIARQMHQYAQFNNMSVDDVFAGVSKPIQNSLDRLFKGQPSAADIQRLLELSEDMKGKKLRAPHKIVLQQFINHVVIPNRTYFDILASFADDIRNQDISTFPPLEILGHKPISLSGRIEHANEDPSLEDQEESLNLAKAKIEVREAIASSEVYHILRDEEMPHLEKMEALVKSNEAEIEAYAGVFDKVEAALEALENKRVLLANAVGIKSDELDDATALNARIDTRAKELGARFKARQKGARKSGQVRALVGSGAAMVLALFDGGAVSGPMGAASAGSLAVSLRRGTRDSLNSVASYAAEEAGSHREASHLDDLLDNLMLQRADLPALKTELDALEEAIRQTQESAEFQELVRNEAKRSYVAETLLVRSLIRNGQNNSLDIAEACGDAGVDSIDAFLDHYKGTRLGLALKKHSHGLADSNDLAVLIAEANCLQGKLDGYDAALKEYVEEGIKPNIASYFAKASKMDAVSQHNLTGYGNELHFSAELQMETARAVRILLANEFGMSVVGREDVRNMFDFWLHRHGDRRLYDEKIRDGEMSNDYPEKVVSFLPEERMESFVDMAKRSVASGRTSFPKVSDMFMRVCAYEYFLPQAIHTGGKDNIFTDYHESPSAYPLVNSVVGEFVKKMSFAGLEDYRAQVGGRLDNVIAQSFIDFFAHLGEAHQQDEKLVATRGRLKDAAHYDDYAPVFDRYTKGITRDALQRFDLFLDIYKTNLEKQLECSTEADRVVLEEQISAVKDIEGGILNPEVVRPGSHEARLRAHNESHTGENVLRR